MATDNAVGTAIRTLRKSAGLTITEAAEIAEVSYHYLSRVENGHVLPTGRWVREVTAAIGRHIQRGVA